jgi:hypothetical protein
MTPKAITSALTAAQVLFLPINGQPSDNDLVRLSDVILPILLKAIYNQVNSVHNLWGLVASMDCYLHHYSTPSIRPATHPACYDPTITTEASCIYCVTPKLPGLLYSKTTRPTRLLSMASRSSSRL